VLNFLLQFCPTHFSEKTLMDRFATLNIGAGRTFPAKSLSPEMRTAIEGGTHRRVAAAAHSRPGMRSHIAVVWDAACGTPRALIAHAIDTALIFPSGSARQGPAATTCRDLARASWTLAAEPRHESCRSHR
jgi:hypothetical protein